MNNTIQSIIYTVGVLHPRCARTTAQLYRSVTVSSIAHVAEHAFDRPNRMSNRKPKIQQGRILQAAHARQALTILSNVINLLSHRAAFYVLPLECLGCQYCNCKAPIKSDAQVILKAIGLTFMRGCFTPRNYFHQFSCKCIRQALRTSHRKCFSIIPSCFLGQKWNIYRWLS